MSHHPNGFSDPVFHSENEVQFPLPTIQPDYSFLPDDAIQHTIPPIDGAFVDASPNVIHYDIFAGMHLNLVDPFKYIWNTKLLGQPMLDAEDMALFPPDIVEEIIKDPQHKTIIPAMNDIMDARRRLLNMANFFDPLGDLDEDARIEKERLESETKTLQVVKPHMFQDDYAKAKTMESAQNNAMNYYYQPVYTEDTIQTWVSKRKYQQYAMQQTDLHAYKTLGEKQETKLLTTVDKTPEAINAYILASFDAMDQPPVHPLYGNRVSAVSIAPFFTQPLEEVIPRHHPDQLPPLTNELQAKSLQQSAQFGPSNNSLVLITATSETKLSTQNVITHEATTNDDGNTVFEGYAIFRPARSLDAEFLDTIVGIDQETIELLSEAKAMSSANDQVRTQTQQTVKVWDSIAQPVPIQQLDYEDSFIARYDENGSVIANTIGSRLSLKPYQLASKTGSQFETARSCIAKLPHVLSVNHPSFYNKSFEHTEKSFVKKPSKKLGDMLQDQHGDKSNNQTQDDISNEGRRYGDDDGDEEDGDDEDGEDLYKKKKSSKKDKKDKKDKKSSKKDKKSKRDRGSSRGDTDASDAEQKPSASNSLNDYDGHQATLPEQEDQPQYHHQQQDHYHHHPQEQQQQHHHLVQQHQHQLHHHDQFAHSTQLDASGHYQSHYDPNSISALQFQDDPNQAQLPQFGFHHSDNNMH